MDDAAPPAPDIEPSGITQIADAAWVIPDRRVPLVPNVGILVGEDAVVVVDPGMGPRNGKRVIGFAVRSSHARRRH